MIKKINMSGEVILGFDAEMTNGQLVFDNVVYHNITNYSEVEVDVPDWVNIGDKYVNGEFVQTIAPVVKPEVPNSITQRQCRLQLVKEGLYEAVNTSLSSMDTEAQIEWEYASEIQRDNVLVSAIQSAFDKDDNWMNQFFINASVL